MQSRINANDKPDVHTRIILGKQLVNPYSVKNMQNAFNYYNLVVPNSRFAGRVIASTHKYIRIMPNTLTHLSELDFLDKSNLPIDPVMQDYPLDYEIVQEGDYYIEPRSSSDLYHPVYALIPNGYIFKSNIPYVTIDEIYEPTEEEYDVETTSLFFANWTNDLAADGIMLTSASLSSYLIAQSIDTTRRVRKYLPAGKIQVQNSDTNAYEPLMKAKISTGRGIFWRYTCTDNNGYFEAAKKYRGEVRIRAKWRGTTATIRKTWNEWLGIQVSDHLMTINKNSNNPTKQIPFSTSVDEGYLWFKGTVHNGFRKYNDYCATNGISSPVTEANVWISAKGEVVASTPMLYKYPYLGTMATIAGIGESNLWDFLIVGLTTPTFGLLPAHLRPDNIYKGLRNLSDGNTVALHQIIFHESGHYSHAAKAGSWFWANLFASEMSNNILRGDSYCNGSLPSLESGKRIALVEGWATLAEYKITTHYYGKARILVSPTSNFILPNITSNPSTQTSQVLNLTDALESFSVYDAPMTLERTDRQSWFLHGVMWDILDNSDETLLNNTIAFSGRYNSSGVYLNRINDKLIMGNNSNNLAPLFNMLTANVNGATDLKVAMLNSNPSFTVPINNLFNSYGY